MLYGQKFLNESNTIDSQDININLTISSKDSELLEFAQDYFINKNETEAVQEGANSEYTEAIKEGYKKYKADIKEARKFYKDSEYSKAKASYVKAEKDAKDIEKEIESVKSDTVLTAIIGYFIASGVTYVQAIILLLTSFIPVLGTVVSVKQTIQGAEEWKRLVKDLKVKGISSKTLNLYRNKVLAFVKVLEETAKLGQEVCDTKKKGK